LYGKQESELYRKFKKEGEKMKNLLKCSSLIRVAVLMVVMVFTASQMTGAYADKPHKHKGKPHKIKLDEHDADVKAGIAQHDTDIKEAIEQHDTDAYNNIVTHDDNMTREHRSLSNQHGGLEEKLDEILEAVQNGGEGAVAPVERTGQTIFSATGGDGDLQKGVAWPDDPRFTDNLDGTITDNLTDLIWDKDADRFASEEGNVTWVQALSHCNDLAANGVDLTDGSVAGEWHLANINEYMSLIHYGFSNPSVPNTNGTAQWTTDGEPFINVQKPGDFSGRYWSSTTTANSDAEAWEVNFDSGRVLNTDKERGKFCWCVRGGQ
jgi:hypothetical protein